MTAKCYFIMNIDQFCTFFVDYLIEDYCLLRNTAPRYQTKKYISQQCIRGQTRGFWASQGKIIFKNLQYYILKKMLRMFCCQLARKERNGM